MIPFNWIIMPVNFASASGFPKNPFDDLISLASTYKRQNSRHLAPHKSKMEEMPPLYPLFMRENIYKGVVSFDRAFVEETAQSSSSRINVVVVVVVVTPCATPILPPPSHLKNKIKGAPRSMR